MMNRSMIQASVTMGQLQHKLDLIGNNIANSNTTGYKSRNANFSSMLFQQIDNLSDDEVEVGRQTPDGVRIGTGAKLGHTNINLQQGSFQNTGRALDVALMGEHHLFQLRVPTEGGAETQFTRAGNFYLNPVGNDQVMLTNSDGYPVLGENGETIIFEDEFDGLTIEKNGQITVTREGEQGVVGQIDVVEAVRPRTLEAAGGNRFRLPDGINGAGVMADVAPNDQQMKNNTLESSNVDISKQMTELLMAQRAYQFNAKSISTSDQMMGLVNQLRS